MPSFTTWLADDFANDKGGVKGGVPGSFPGRYSHFGWAYFKAYAILDRGRAGFLGKPEAMRGPIAPWVEKMEVPSFNFVEQKDQPWANYHIKEYDINYSGKNVKEYKAIIHNDALVAIVGRKYKLLPNEEVAKLADDMARIVAAIPFDKYSGKKQDHVVYDKHQTLMNALYAFEDPVEIRNGDKVQLGYTVQNAIDGRKAFGCGSFTFRPACSNTVLFGYRGFKMADRIASAYMRHTKSLTTERAALETLILNVIEQTKSIVKVYRAWTEEMLNREIAQRLSRAVPKKFLPDYIETDKGKVTKLLSKPSLWDTYNDITGNVNHQSQADLLRKQTVYNHLHAALAA